MEKVNKYKNFIHINSIHTAGQISIISIIIIIFSDSNSEEKMENLMKFFFVLRKDLKNRNFFFNYEMMVKFKYYRILVVGLPEILPDKRCVCSSDDDDDNNNNYNIGNNYSADRKFIHSFKKKGSMKDSTFLIFCFQFNSRERERQNNNDKKCQIQPSFSFIIIS